MTTRIKLRLALTTLSAILAASPPAAPAAEAFKSDCDTRAGFDRFVENVIDGLREADKSVDRLREADRLNAGRIDAGERRTQSNSRLLARIDSRTEGLPEAVEHQAKKVDLTASKLEALTERIDALESRGTQAAEPPLLPAEEEEEAGFTQRVVYVQMALQKVCASDAITLTAGERNTVAKKIAVIEFLLNQEELATPLMNGRSVDQYLDREVAVLERLVLRVIGTAAEQTPGVAAASTPAPSAETPRLVPIPQTAVPQQSRTADKPRPTGEGQVHRVDHVVDHESLIPCKTATFTAKCVSGLAPDGFTYHGNLYSTCVGLVLVTHQQK